MAAENTYRVLLLGDFSYGESYRRAGGEVIRTRGYAHSTAKLRPFIDSCDKFILNLETPLAAEADYPAPYADLKPWSHWADPEGSGQALLELGVDAVSLANNHTVDLGHPGLEASFRNLDKLGIEYFGAGQNRARAERPYRIELPDSVGGGQIAVYGSFQFSRRGDEVFHSFATKEAPGCARLSASRAVPTARHEERSDTLHVAFPHWGPNYVWKTPRQENMAQKLLAEGYDLVVGHGSHAMQEIARQSDRWVVYSIGNGNFQSAGRWKKFEEENGILPFGFWTILEVVQKRGGGRRVLLKLYPVYSDNRVTDYQPGPVSSEDFDRAVKALSERSDPSTFLPGGGVTLASDDLGHYLQLDVSDWSPTEAPAPTRIESSSSSLQGVADGSMPNTYDDAESLEIARQRDELKRHIGAVEIARAAEREGASVDWLLGSYAWAAVEGRRVPLFGNVGTESVVGVNIVGDKQLTKDFLLAAGVSVPAGRQVGSADDAVDAQEEIGRAVVVKPLNGNMGKGVTVNLTDPRSIREAFDRAAVYGAVIVEQYINGQEYRAHATPDECVGVFERLLPTVIGDGTSTIEELVHAKNELRKLNPATRKSPIPVDEVTQGYLGRQGLSLATILPTGYAAVVRDVNGVTSGGESRECLDTIGGALKSTAIGAVRAIPGMGWGGVDILLEKETGEPFVIEINSDAAFYGSSFPVYGERRDLGAALWRELRQAANPEPQTQPEPLSLNPQPLQSLGGEPLAAGSSSISLQALLQAAAESRDMKVERYARSIWAARSGDGETRWFSGVQSTQDSRISLQPLRRQLLLSKALDRAGVPRAKGKLVGDLAGLRAFLHDSGEPARLFAAKDQPGAERAFVLLRPQVGPADPLAAALFKGSNRWYAQVYERGLRFRVVAAASEALAILAPESQRLPSVETVAQLSALAVYGVRAVPGLRWAVVDILVPAASSGRILVESMTSRPVLDSADLIVAGNMQRVYDMFFSEAEGA